MLTVAFYLCLADKELPDTARDSETECSCQNCRGQEQVGRRLQLGFTGNSPGSGVPRFYRTPQGKGREEEAAAAHSAQTQGENDQRRGRRYVCVSVYQ